MTDAGLTETELTEGLLAPGATESAELAALVDDVAILSTEQQEHVAALHGEDRWGVDAMTQRFTFTAPDGTALVCGAHLLGTAAPGPGSWLWGWVNANGFPDAFFERSEAVRAATAARELVDPEVPLAAGLPLRLTLAAKSVTGIRAHYSAPVAGGTRMWLLIEHPDLALPAPTVVRTLEAVRVTLESVQLTDHRAAVHAWARHRGVPAAAVEPEEDLAPATDAVRLPVSDGEVLVGFDAAGRIVNLRATARPVEAESAAPQQAAPPDPSPAAGRPRGFLSRLLGRD